MLSRKSRYLMFAVSVSVFFWLGPGTFADNLTSLPGIRGAGYGYAHAAFCDGIEALYWNPAGLVIGSRRTYVGALVHNPQGLNIPLGIGQFGVASPRRARGVWAVGMLSMRDERSHLLQIVGYGRRLNSLLKIGVAAYHDNLSVMRLSRWGVGLGVTIQPAQWFRGSLVVRARGSRIRGREDTTAGTWNTSSFALAVGNLSPMVFLAGVDPAIRRAAIGMGYKLSQYLTLRTGVSATFSSSGQRTMPRSVQLHFGLSTGGTARFEYAFVLSSDGVFAHSFGFRLPLGPIIRQITVRPRILTASPCRPVGSFATYEPTLQSKGPKEILAHVDNGGIEDLIRRYRDFIRYGYDDPAALKRYNGLASDVHLSNGMVVRIPLRDSWLDSLSVAEIAALLDKSFTLETAHWPAWQLKGLLSCLVGQSLAAESQLGKARTLNPNSPEVLSVLAQLYVCDGHPEKAVELLEQIAIVEGKGSRWAGLGLALELAGRHREAIRAFRKADSLGYSSPSLLFFWGEAHLRLGEIDKGKAKLSELIQKHRQSLFALRAAELLRTYSQGGHGADVVVLKRAVTCRGVGRHPLRPQEISGTFPEEGRVYLYVEVSRQSRSRIHIQPAWYREGELVFRSERGWVVGSSNRTYGYKTMHGVADRGHWHVELRVRETGQYLGQVGFVVGPGESGESEEP